MSILELGGQAFGLRDLELLLESRPPRLEVNEEARRRVQASREHVEQVERDGRVVYGINTGFGKLAKVQVQPDQLRELQINLLRSHAAGVGEPLSHAVSQLAFALRIANMAHGLSGVRTSLLDHAVAMFNAGIVPVLPCQGSVGASGDLAPLAHMALLLVGEGKAWKGREQVSGSEALSDAGLSAMRLQSKEGLALINGTQVSTAILASALVEARRLAMGADLAAALTLEAYKGTPTAFDARIHDARGQLGQQRVAARMRGLLEGSAIVASHKDCDRVQDNYCLRCVPQVHGAALDAIDHVSRVVLREANAVTDNPLVFDNGDILSGGNFHAEPVAMAADFLKIATAELANISERRVELLVNPDLSGLPAFLAPESGVQSGLMIAHVTAAALVSENKVLAHPGSVDSIPTSAGKEDHVSMATSAARHAAMIVQNTRHVLAIEVMTAFHAMAFETELRPNAALQGALDLLAEHVPPWTNDREPAPDIEAVAELLASGRLQAAAGLSDDFSA
ncbi:MAG: histidine ammonia-lyase [Planctomycetota bacterium]|nr:MAG: histidine ammonia-lyase [Planctomycetota bacterium]